MPYVQQWDGARGSIRLDSRRCTWRGQYGFLGGVRQKSLDASQADHAADNIRETLNEGVQWAREQNNVRERTEQFRSAEVVVREGECDGGSHRQRCLRYDKCQQLEDAEPVSGANLIQTRFLHQVADAPSHPEHFERLHAR